jgi:polyhydroxyalkanoate synthesis repressor PhaR
MFTEPVLIKRYGGHRLYDTAKAAYVSLEDLEHLVLQRIRFVVCDAKTGADITRDVLEQMH